MDKIITRTCEISLDQYGILYLKMLKGSEMDLGDAIDNFLVSKSLAKHQPALKLVDLRERRKISKEARAFIKKGDIAEHNLAKAIVVNSWIRKYSEHFLQSLAKPAFPVKVFTSHDEALSWLKTHLPPKTWS